MKKPNVPGKWNSTDKPRAVLASVPAPDVTDKTGTNVTILSPKSAEPDPSIVAPVDDAKRDSNN